jgi:hypothetical protein
MILKHLFLGILLDKPLADSKNRTGKEFSTVVLAFIGSEKLIGLGGKIIHSIHIANKWCNITPYIPFGTTTQCTNCQGFGHPKTICKAEPICTVCAWKHVAQKRMPENMQGRIALHPPSPQVYQLWSEGSMLQLYALAILHMDKTGGFPL